MSFDSDSVKSKPRKKAESITVTVSSIPTERETASGWRILEFTAETTRVPIRLFKCKRLYAPGSTDGSLVDGAAREGVTSGAKIGLRGNMDAGEFVAWEWFTHAKPKSPRELAVAAAGGETAYLALQRETAEHERRSGRDYRWIPEERRWLFWPMADLVEWDGRNYSKMDYILEKLGGKFVSERLKEAGILGAQSILKSKFKKEAYEKLKEDLLREAKNIYSPAPHTKLPERARGTDDAVRPNRDSGSERRSLQEYLRGT